VAVINKENKIYDEGTKAAYERIIKCDSKGWFTCNVPDVWEMDDICEDINKTGLRGLSGKSLLEIENKFRAVFKNYNSKEESTSLVIVYAFSYVIRDEQGGAHTHWSHFGFDIQAATFRKTKIVFKSSGVMRYVYDRVYNRVSDPNNGTQLSDSISRCLSIDKYSKCEERYEILYSDIIRDCLNSLSDKVETLILNLKDIFTNETLKTISVKSLMQLIGKPEGK
jgi:hypothetical protein